jgi:hypothetical protein
MEAIFGARPARMAAGVRGVISIFPSCGYEEIQQSPEVFRAFG